MWRILGMKAKRVHDKVEQILQASEQCRNSDKKLLLNYWHTEGFYLTERQIEQFLKCTSAESITRARRTLRAKYPANETVTNERFNKFKQFRGEAQTI